MKPYIITFHYPRNYGAFLQAFALNKKINACITNFEPGYYVKVGQKGKKFMPLLWRLLGMYRYLKINKTKFPEYPKLEASVFFNSTKHNNIYDGQIAICGSDQIWNPSLCYCQENMYFASFANFSKRISYAASLGMKQWPKDFEQRVLPMLQKFQAISVREESSVPYLTSLGLKNVVCVCDPTILHKADFYREQFPANKINKDEYTFVYKIREHIPDSVQEIFANKIITVDLQNRKTIVSVTDWLSNIDNAKFIVTDSFHCAVFCILFHKPFIVLANHGTGKGMNERFQTLLGKTDLMYRVLPQETTKEDVLERLNTPIDWNKVDSIIDEWRTYSANWLKQALEE